MALTDEEKKHEALVQALYRSAERTYLRIDNALKRSMLEDVRAAHCEIVNDIMKEEKNSQNIFSPETMQLMHASQAAFKMLEILDGADGH